MPTSQLLWKRHCKLEVINDLGSITIEDLHISFHIDMTTEHNTDKSTITIYNLNKDHRERIIRKGSSYKLYVAYGIANPIKWGLLLHADIIKSSNRLHHEYEAKSSPSTRHGTEWETVIELGDGTSTEHKLLKKSYHGKVDTTTIIKDAVKAMKDVKLPSDIDSLPKASFDNGITISKSAMDAIHAMANKIGAKAVVHKKTLKFIRPAHVNSSTRIKSISAESGLIESPIKTDKGIEFKILIDPDLSVGDRIYILSPSLGMNNKKVWLVTKISVDGSLRENTWEMKCNAIPEKGFVVV